MKEVRNALSGEVVDFIIRQYRQEEIDLREMAKVHRESGDATRYGEAMAVAAWCHHQANKLEEFCPTIVMEGNFAFARETDNG